MAITRHGPKGNGKILHAFRFQTENQFLFLYLIALCVFLKTVSLNAQVAHNQGAKVYSSDLEYITSLDADMDIEIYSFRLAYGSYLLKNLAFYHSFDATTTQGFRVVSSDEEELRTNAESFGLGLSFYFRWYAVRIGSIGLYIDPGAGMLYTFDSFPPGGTKLNFTIRLGGGLLLP